MSSYKLLFNSALLLLSSIIYSQENNPDTIRMGYGGYIEFLPGNMPLVISIPHGGYLLPDEIPERPCTNCAKHQDEFTLEIGLALRYSIYKNCGLYPYVIINNLHRTRLDPNRNIDEAADGNEIAEIAWKQFQNFIDSANADVQRIFGKGLYIDFHGHRHKIKRTELGYLLSSEELQMDNDFLNSESFVEYSSIRNLVQNNPDSLSYMELIRGKESLGSLFEKRGYTAVPSMEHPFPENNEPHFSGGYNTMRHGSSEGGTIDGIQIELDEELRSDINRRQQLADDLASILLEFIELHYFPDSEFKSNNPG